jgi:hypothetical protein
MSDGQRKQERDFTPEVTALLPEVDKLAAVRHSAPHRVGGFD